MFAILVLTGKGIASCDITGTEEKPIKGREAKVGTDTINSQPFGLSS